MTTEERLNLAVDQTLFAVRKWWLIHAVVVGVVLWFSLAGWWLLVIPIYMSLTYQLIMHVATSALADALADDLEMSHRLEAMEVARELKQKLQSGEIEQDDEYFAILQKYDLNISKVEAFSEEKVGRFGDVIIHEWVEMHDMTTRKVERFYFEQVAEVNPDGTHIIPSIEGKVTAVIDGIVYSRQVQPA